MYSMNERVSVSFIERLHALQAAVIFATLPPSLPRAFAWVIKPVVFYPKIV